MRDAKSFTANIHMSTTVDKTPATGSIAIKRPLFVLFRMKWGKSDYSFSSLPDYVVAIERGNRRYREYGSQGRLFVPETEISQTPEYGFPAPLLAGTLRSIVPPGTTFKASGKETVEGVPVDVVRARYTTQFGTVDVMAKIDAQGKLLYYERDSKSGEGNMTTRLSFSGYKINPTLSDASFRTPLPLGFVPETLPADSYPLNVGEKMSFEGWKPLSGTSSLSGMSSKKVTFLAISEPGCEVSIRSTRTIDQLKNQLESRGVACAALSLSTASNQTPVFRTLATFFDPTGKAPGLLRAPGTPLFLLVSDTGVVTRVWYGFDNGQGGNFVQDVLSWIEKSKGKKPA